MTTRISDIVVPEVFSAYVQQESEQKSRIIQSGVAIRSGFLDQNLSGGGMTFNVPSFQDLADDEERVSNDVPHAEFTGGAAEPDPGNIDTSLELAIRLSRNQSWSSMNLANELAGADAMAAIVSRVANYWQRRWQALFIATWNGVIATNAAAPGAGSTHAAGDLAFDGSAANINAQGIIQAIDTIGDSMNDLNVMFVHSRVYNRLAINNLITFVEESDGKVLIPTYLGRELIVDDQMPVTGSGALAVYDTWLFGQGSTSFGLIPGTDGTAVERKEGGGNGAGQEILYSRWRAAMHPTGHAWRGATTAGGGPANSALSAAATFDRVYPERKQIKFARFTSLADLTV